MLKDFYTKLSDLGQKLFYAALAIWVLALFDVLFLRPVMIKLYDLDSAIHEKINIIKSDVRFLSYRDKIFRERKEFSIYQSGESLTEKEIIAGFLKTVELLGSETGIKVKLNKSDVVPKKGYIQYFADLECEGRLENVITFMHKVNTTDSLLKIVKFNMAGKRASAEEVKASMRISKLIIDLKSIGDYFLPGEEEWIMDAPKGPGFASSGEEEGKKEEDVSAEVPADVKGTSIWQRKFKRKKGEDARK